MSSEKSPLSLNKDLEGKHPEQPHLDPGKKISCRPPAK